MKATGAALVYLDDYRKPAPAPPEDRRPELLSEAYRRLAVMDARSLERVVLGLRGGRG